MLEQGQPYGLYLLIYNRSTTVNSQPDALTLVFDSLELNRVRMEFANDVYVTLFTLL